MSVIIDNNKGKEVAEHLYKCFSTSTSDFGKKGMPEDIILKDIPLGIG